MKRVFIFAVSVVITLVCAQYLLKIYTNTFESITASVRGNDDLHILIDINKKTLYAITGNHVIAKYPVASGKPDTPSPVGDFLIIQKSKWGEGFGTSWLGLNVPWGIYGIHGTTMPSSIGRAASHGCIRMRNSDVDKLYKIVKVGTPVKIIGGDYGMLGNGYRVLSPGDRGADVYLVQSRLKNLGFYKGSIDGIYGSGMEKAVNDFQKKNKLPVTNKITESLYKKLGIILFE
ncbi:MAG: L,D-transpeptidase family protein [Clostridiales bacterium]|nr:L,D-transpeptidase family protein [Clostridiales bacterium]HBM80729.1 hypothetical protein [Clostridiaceae bacterium]